MFDVAVPACDKFGYSALKHGQAVEDGDAGVVGFVGDAADVDADNITVAVIALLGHIPYMQIAGCLFDKEAIEMVAVDVAAPPCGGAGDAGVLNVIETEHATPGALKCFVGGGWKFAGKTPLFGDFFLFSAIPIDGFECGTEAE